MKSPAGLVFIVDVVRYVFVLNIVHSFLFCCLLSCQFVYATHFTSAHRVTNQSLRQCHRVLKWSRLVELMSQI